MELDNKDKKLIRELRFNGRESISTIAKKIQISKEVANYRIKKLIEQGIIIRFIPEIDNAKLGYSIYRLAIKLKAVDSKFEKELTNYMFKSDLPITWFGYTYGKYDLFMDFMVKNPIEFHESIEQLLSDYGEYILDKEIGIQIKDIFKHYYFLYDRSKGRKKISHKKYKEIEKIDDTNIQILSLLFEDARMPYVEIASKINTTPDTVRYRMKQMKNTGIIEKYITTIDRNPLDYKKFKVLLYFRKTKPEDIKKMINYSKRYKHISHISKTVGSWDMELDFDAKTPEHFNNLFGDFREKFHHLIHDHSVLIIHKYYYTNPFIEFLKKDKK